VLGFTLKALEEPLLSQLILKIGWTAVLSEVFLQDCLFESPQAGWLSSKEFPGSVFDRRVDVPVCCGWLGTQLFLPEVKFSPWMIFPFALSVSKWFHTNSVHRKDWRELLAIAGQCIPLAAQLLRFGIVVGSFGGGTGCAYRMLKGMLFTC